MDKSTSTSYFLRHRTVTIIVLVVVFLVAGLFIWQHSNITSTGSNSLTPEQIQQLIQATTSSGPETISTSEKQELIESSSASTTSSETLSSDDKQKLINAMSSQ